MENDFKYFLRLGEQETHIGSSSSHGNIFPESPIGS